MEWQANPIIVGQMRQTAVDFQPKGIDIYSALYLSIQICGILVVAGSSTRMLLCWRTVSFSFDATNIVYVVVVVKRT